MGSGVKIDDSEPQQIEAIIKQSIPETIRINMKGSGWADYQWLDVNNQPEHVERKQVAEILAKPGDIELQIQKELAKCSRLTLVVEGVAEAIPSGIQTYELTDNGKYFRPSRKYNDNYDRYEGFLVGLSIAGVTVWKTSSWLGTAQYIVRRYAQAQKTKHTTLNRYIVPSLPTFSPDPQVQALLGLCQGYSGLGVGPEIAQKLISVYGTIYNLLQAEPADIASLVPGISAVRMLKIQQAIGKT